MKDLNLKLTFFILSYLAKTSIEWTLIFNSSFMFFVCFQRNREKIEENSRTFWSLYFCFNRIFLLISMISWKKICEKERRKYWKIRKKISSNKIYYLNFFEFSRGNFLLSFDTSTNFSSITFLFVKFKFCFTSLKLHYYFFFFERFEFSLIKMDCFTYYF